MQHRSSIHFLIVAALFAVSQSTTLAQPESGNSYRAPSKFAGKTVVLPIGTTFEGRIQKTIGSSASRSGDSFSVEVSAPVLANGTEVLIPSGAEVVGEVVEAVSSSSQPHDKGRIKPLGILRVQITSLKMPDGMTYPLVASLAPDAARGGNRGGDLSARKSTVAYVGSQASFDAVNPALQAQPRNRRGGRNAPRVLHQDGILKDPVLGESAGGQSNSHAQVRALVRKGRDLIIQHGSSLTIRLDGPLKIAFAASNAQNTIDRSTANEPVAGSGRKHFAKSRAAAAPEGSHTTQEGDKTVSKPQASSPSQPIGNPAIGGNAEPGGTPQTGSNSQTNSQLIPVEQPGSSF